MNETKGNARTKPTRNQKSPGFPDNFEREPLKEREMNSLSDSEKTNEIKINNNQENAAIKIAQFVYNEVNKQIKKFKTLIQSKARLHFHQINFRTKIK